MKFVSFETPHGPGLAVEDGEGLRGLTPADSGCSADLRGDGGAKDFRGYLDQSTEDYGRFHAPGGPRTPLLVRVVGVQVVTARVCAAGRVVSP